MHTHHRLFPLVISALALIACLIQVAPARAQAQTGRFADEIAAFEQWDQKNTPPQDAILFVGSSSIRMWTTAQDFPMFKVINRGFGGSEISDVLAYFDQVVSKYQPRAIVMYVGDNDIAAGEPPEQVAGDFESFVTRVRSRMGATPIFYISIKPSLARWDQWPLMKQANDLIQARAGEAENVYFVDTATPMLGPDGKPQADLFQEDGLHMSRAGYEIWDGILLPLLTRLAPAENQ
ncbi:MAG TPA: SGNH/GDSL hydrolase family protein [Rhodothermales bacterium]|nr:SGNH/GDSL hydrolase family protein [Rhodothermales bacterium]